MRCIFVQKVSVTGNDNILAAEMAKQLNKSTGSEPVARGRGAGAENTVGTSSLTLRSFKIQAVILAILCLVLYGNTFSHESAFDDRMAIVDNEYVQQGVTGIPATLTSDAYESYLTGKGGGNQLSGGRYRPLSLITFAIEQQILGTVTDSETPAAREERVAQEMHPRHVVNMLLYLLSVIALLYLFREVYFRDNYIVAFIAALLFAVHPIHTEVVANVKSRDEILSVLFITLTLILVHRYQVAGKMKYLWLGLVSFFLALLSKEYAVSVLVLIPLQLWVFTSRSAKECINKSLPFLLPFALYLLLRFSAVSDPAPGAAQNVLNNPYLYAMPGQKVASELAVLLRYIELLFFPNPLSADYSYRAIPYVSFANPVVWLSLTVNGSLVAAMSLLIGRKHVLGLALAFYFIHLAIVSNIFFNVGAPMGERLIYHSSIGFCMVVAWLLYKGFEKLNSPSMLNWGLGVVVALLVSVSALATISRNNDWKNDATLFLADVEKVPNSLLANNNAAAACMSYAKLAGDGPERTAWFEKAIAFYSHALSVDSSYTIALLNRGLCYYNLHYPAKALPDWLKVRQYNPGQQNLEKYMAIAANFFMVKGAEFETAGRLDDAVHAYGKSTEATPLSAAAWYKLGAAYAKWGQKENAMKALQNSLKIDPSNGQVQQLYQQVSMAR